MSYALAQVDPVPPPVRPINWPMILGWTAVVGMTLAVFSGTINLSGEKVRPNRRRRSVRRNANPSLSELPEDAVRITEGIWASLSPRDLDWRVWEEQLDGRWELINVMRTLREVRQRYDPDTFPTENRRRTRRNAGRRSSRQDKRRVHELESAILGPRATWDMAAGTRRPYEEVRERMISEIGYDRFRDIQNEVFRRWEMERRGLRANARRSSHARPKPPKFSELGTWEAIGIVRDAHPIEHLHVLPPGVAAKFKKLPPGLYKYGWGPKKGETITQFKKATLKGALTSTRIGASKAGQYHWVVDNFDPKFPVVVRGIDDRGRSYFRIEEYAKNFVKVPVLARRATASR